MEVDESPLDMVASTSSSTLVSRPAFGHVHANVHYHPYLGNAGVNRGDAGGGVHPHSQPHPFEMHWPSAGSDAPPFNHSMSQPAFSSDQRTFRERSYSTVNPFETDEEYRQRKKARRIARAKREAEEKKEERRKADEAAAERQRQELQRWLNRPRKYVDRYFCLIPGDTHAWGDYNHFLDLGFERDGMRRTQWSHSYPRESIREAEDGCILLERLTEKLFDETPIIVPDAVLREAMVKAKRLGLPNPLSEHAILLGASARTDPIHGNSTLIRPQTFRSLDEYKLWSLPYFSDMICRICGHELKKEDGFQSWLPSWHDPDLELTGARMHTMDPDWESNHLFMHCNNCQWGTYCRGCRRRDSIKLALLPDKKQFDTCDCSERWLVGIFEVLHCFDARFNGRPFSEGVKAGNNVANGHGIDLGLLTHALRIIEYYYHQLLDDIQAGGEDLRWVLAHIFETSMILPAIKYFLPSMLGMAQKHAIIIVRCIDLFRRDGFDFATRDHRVFIGSFGVMQFYSAERLPWEAQTPNTLLFDGKPIRFTALDGICTRQQSRPQFIPFRQWTRENQPNHAATGNWQTHGSVGEWWHNGSLMFRPWSYDAEEASKQYAGKLDYTVRKI